MQGYTRQDDRDLINLWINDRFTYVIQIMEQSLHTAGLAARTRVESNNIITYVIHQDRRGIIDMRRVLMDIATRESSYDYGLESALYEAAKMRRIIGGRVETIKALLSDSAMDGLCELSRKSGMRFRVIRVGS